MTEANRRWTDDRIDRLATAVESNTAAIAALQSNVDVLVGIVIGQQELLTTALEEIRDIKVEIRDIKVEIRGLQTENRRILDRLFGQQEGEQ